tara:strand:+ start:925 stop:1104 length:180 start_codon:yes stop_codon:yes gene_type:complete
MEEVVITNAKYNSFDGQNCSITCVYGGKKVSVPLAQGNRHYDEIMRQVEAGTLTIQDAD